MNRPCLVLALLLTALAGAGCGGDGGDGGDRPAAREARRSLNGADVPRAGDFPVPGNRSMQQLADSVGRTGTQVGLAVSVLTPGRNRIAFGVLDQSNRFVYAPTAVYVARKLSSRASGPYLAPADLLVTEAPFRSRQAATETDPFAAVYEATNVLLDAPGRWVLLVVSKVAGQLVAAGTEVQVRRRSPVPEVGERPPAVPTETLAGAAGNTELIDTRVPPSDMHRVSFDDVLGKKPVALLFATPALCQSRVCGPVVDVALQLKERYGDRVEFIHQEVYVDNDPQKGLREPLRRFGLQTEPWLFTVGRDGRIAARLEGSFGLKAFERALQAAV
jgi:hypothetical protein